VCPASGTAQVYLTLELTTNTPRVGVTIYTKIKNFTPPSTIGSEVTGSPVKQCFGLELNQPLNRVTFSSPFTWTCNTAIVLTDIFIGWGTGNTNFCTSNNFQCPATPSKCYSLPPGSFVAIETPQPLDDNDAKCSDQPGGTTATFNLTGLNVTSSSNVTITWWENYTAPSTFANSIATPGSYSSSSKNVYAKITSNADATVFSVSTVTLTVNQKPSLAITDPAAICSPGTVDLNTNSIVAGSILPGTITWSFSTASDGSGPVANAAAVGDGTFYIKATTNTTPACSDIKAVTVTVKLTPANPQVSVVQPNCANANGTVTVTSPLDGGVVDYEYKNNAGSWQDGVDFTVAAGAGYSITVRNKNGQCVSSGAASGTMGAQPQTPGVPSATVIQPTCATATGSITVNSPDAAITYTLTGPSPAITTQSNTTGIFSGLAPGTYGLTATKNGCTSGSVSKTVNPSLTNPSFTVCLVQPTLCASTGSVTVNATGGSGFTYKLNNGAPQGSNVFSNLASGSVTSITVANSDGCSATVSCANLVQSCPAPGPARISNSQTVESPVSSTTVKAYPNPFSDRIKFMVTSTVAGNGNLEIYNMMGQKVKTVYQGYIAAGTQVFELSMPKQQVANLVYVLRIGDKKMTGKILQVNQ
jgi:hypothetical protein